MHVGLFIFGNVLIQIDHGALPACFAQVQKALEIDEFKFGLLGSTVYIGNAVGAAASAYFFQASDKVQYTLAGSTMLNAVVLFAFCLNTNFYLAILHRFLTGFLQIFICIFGPVWVDRFAPESQKSVVLTLLLLGPPLGIVGGYGLAYACIKHSTWRTAYYIQLVLAIPIAFGFLAFSSDYTDVQKAIRHQEACRNRIRGSQPGETDADELFGSIEEYQKNRKDSFGSALNTQFYGELKLLLTNRLFCGICIALAGIYFILTGI